MMINDKLITMKMKPRVAKHMAWGWRGGGEKRQINPDAWRGKRRLSWRR